MHKRLQTSFGGVVGYDGNFFFALCERLEIPYDAQLQFLHYLELYEDALLTSQSARRGEGNHHAGQTDRTPDSDEL